MVARGRGTETRSCSASHAVFENPRVLAPAALQRVHHERAFHQRNPRQPAGKDVDVFAIENVGPQVNVASFEAVLDNRRHAGERQHRLRHGVPGVALNQASVLLPLLFGGTRTEQDAVAAGFVRRLDHQLVEVRQDVAALLLVGTDVGWNVGQTDLFAQIVPNHLRNVRVDRLVVGDAGARGVRQGHAAGSVDFH